MSLVSNKPPGGGRRIRSGPGAPAPTRGEEGAPPSQPLSLGLPAGGPHDLDAIAQAVARLNGGKTPAQVEASRNPVVRDPGTALQPPFKGYRWDPEVLAKVMRQTGVADATAILETAIALDQNQRYLDADRLLEAARRGAAHVSAGFKWSPSALADVMRQTGAAEETAILRMAKRLDNGDRELSEDELLRAAHILQRVVDAHDFVAIARAMNSLHGRSDVSVQTLAITDGGLPIDVARFASARQPPALRVLVTGGVHGDEPCGASSALLLIEQLAANPAMRQDIEWVVVPVVNPRALVNGTRETPEGIDINREGKDDPSDPLEIDAMQALHKQSGPFALALDLHSGKSDRNGFWVLQQSRDAGDDIAPDAVGRFATEWPVLHGDARPYNLSDPGVATSANPGTLKGLAIDHGARWAATVEAPGSIAYREQVLGENDIVHQMVLEARRRMGGS
ncbi:MAG: DUF2817 domain-containing protein [Deltaproteobacteria bacterium]|nr:DUF2817 domain-containing protein [Deltaproteobacteria bacterium]